MKDSTKNTTYRYTTPWGYSIVPFFIIFMLPGISFFLPYIGAWYLQGENTMTINAWAGAVFAAVIGCALGQIVRTGIVVTPRYVEIRRFFTAYRINNEDVKSIEVASEGVSRKGLGFKAPVIVRITATSGAVYDYVNARQINTKKRMSWAESIKTYLPESTVIAASGDLSGGESAKNQGMNTYRRMRAPSLVSILAILWAFCLYVLPKL